MSKEFDEFMEGMKEWSEDTSEAPDVKDLQRRIKELEMGIRDILYLIEYSEPSLHKKLKDLVNK